MALRLYYHGREFKSWLQQRRRLWILACCATFSFLLLIIFQPNVHSIRHSLGSSFSAPPNPFDSNHWPSGKATHGKPRRRCVGPRGFRVDHPESQDLPRGVSKLKNLSYPAPTFGSYEDLGLPQTWMTFTQRYGPYGYGEDNEEYPFDKVHWPSVNWGKLQDQCLLANQHQRLKARAPLQNGAAPRFRLLGDGYPPVPSTKSTGRQAVILRSWSTYKYKPEDFWNIRSIVSEAGMATGGKFTVFLLVDVKHDDGARIHTDDDFYQQILEESVPPEFRNMAVLFHESIQESWYKKVRQFKPIWQIMQPLQLFAHFYDEFDHFWQFEMDTRFTGDVGKMLDSFSRFGNQAPYKQARERASWNYMLSAHGTYSEFTDKVNTGLEGSATVWGPIEIGAIPNPLGGYPPVSDPVEDRFEWGVGEDAHVLLYSSLTEVNRFEQASDWVFQDWFSGFNAPAEEVPRFTCAPAQARASRALLEVIHSAQHEQGLRIPSEATLPSFALWHGLKIVQVPLPKFQWPSRPLKELDAIYNGCDPAESVQGIADGPLPYRKTILKFYSRPRTWEWRGELTDTLYDRWMTWAKKHRKDEQNDSKDDGRPKYNYGLLANSSFKRDAADGGPIPDELPPFMPMVDGEVYMPGLLMHPRKTNENIPDD